MPITLILRKPSRLIPVDKIQTRKRMRLLSIKVLVLFVAAFIAVGESFAQEAPKKPKKVNFGYSKNPPIREAKVKPSVKKAPAKKGEVDPKKTKADPVVSKRPADKSNNIAGGANIENISMKMTEGIDTPDGEVSTPDTDRGQELTLAKKTREIAKKASNNNLSPMEIYKVGNDDVLFIGFQSGEASSSKYYTVLNDGTIDYPLAGGLIPVTGLTTDEIEDLLRGKIKLYENPEVSVRVREHASHKITVAGMVEKPGEKMLQREAMPLYVIKAEAIVDPEADSVTVRRKESEVTFSLADDEKQGFLIYPGDIIEFGSSKSKGSAADNFFYIGGFVRQFGRQEYVDGMTLTQAIMASGGLRTAATRKVVIRRKNDEGLLESEVHSLKEIKNGKKPDPVIHAGDTIEEKQ